MELERQVFMLIYVLNFVSDGRKKGPVYHGKGNPDTLLEVRISYSFHMFFSGSGKHVCEM